MKLAILFALVASACADNQNVVTTYSAVAPGNFGYPDSNFVYPGSNFVQTPTPYSAVAPGNFAYPGSNFVYPGSNFVQTPTTFSAVAPGNFAYPGINFVYPGSSFVPTTYSAVNPGRIAFRSAVIPSAASYQSAPAAYIAPITTYSAPAVATYSAVAPIVAPKTIAQTKGSSHITY